MRRQKERVYIQEPPVEQLHQRRSCFKRTCMTGCGCLIFFVIGSVFLLQLIGGPRERKVNELPADVRSSIPLYEKDALEEIRLIPGSEQGRGLQVIAYIPKLIVSPIAASLESQTTLGPDDTFLSRIKRFVQMPVTEEHDTYVITWHKLAADEDFVLDFYKQSLHESGFDTSDPIKRRGSTEYSFTKGSTSGTVLINDTIKGAGTDEVIVTISLKSYGN